MEKAAEFDAHQLRELGKRLVAVIDPEAADAYEAKKLDEQEARARKKTEFRMWDDGNGLAHGRFTLPEAQAAMLRKALHGLASAKHVRATEGAGSYDYEKPTPQKMGWAFVEYIENYPTDKLPNLGGLAATVVIIAEADVFTKGARKAGTTDAGVKVSPGQLLRWACQAKIIPAVLDKDGHVLDLGRSHRLHTPAQRLALIVEQKTCQHPTCDTLGVLLPRPPHQPLGPRRRNQHPRSSPALPLPPPPSPHRQHRLPVADIAGSPARSRPGLLLLVAPDTGEWRQFSTSPRVSRQEGNARVSSSFDAA